MRHDLRFLVPFTALLLTPLTGGLISCASTGPQDQAEADAGQPNPRTGRDDPTAPTPTPTPPSMSRDGGVTMIDAGDEEQVGEPPEAPCVDCDPEDPVTNPSMGMGLNPVADYSTQLPFLNHFRSARFWLPQAPGAWHTQEQVQDLDEAGYPRSLPSSGSGVQYRSLATLMFRDIGGMYTAGRYVVMYDGQGTVEYDFSARRLSGESRPGRDVIEVDGGDGGILLRIVETDPQGTGDYIRNIRVVREDQLPLFEAGLLFNPEWLDLIEDFRALRFMDWMDTNNSHQSEWSDRPTVDTASWAWRGVPVEVMCELANTVQADPWFNLPHQATDGYIRNFAQVVKDCLDPGLKAYFEFSNEVWNWQFEQAHYAKTQGEARWGTDVHAAWVQWYGMRASQMAQIITQVYGDEIDRAVRVIATQSGWVGLEDPILNAPAWVAEGNPAPHTLVDAYAMTAYFTAGLGMSETYGIVRGWLDQGDRARALDLALTQAADGSVFPAGGHIEDIISNLNYHTDVARRYGLDPVVYEGGSHIAGRPGDDGNGNFVDVLADEEFVQFLIDVNRDPRMEQLYTRLLEGWRDAGGHIFSHHVDVGPASKWGSWGARWHLNDDSPRWRALERFNRSQPAWWNAERAGSFADGRILVLGGGADQVYGTSERDYLAGGGGDDEFAGDLRQDGIDGGPGTDTVVLPGTRTDYVVSRVGTQIHFGGNGHDLVTHAVERVRFEGEGQDEAIEAVMQQ